MNTAHNIVKYSHAAWRKNTVSVRRFSNVLNGVLKEFIQQRKAPNQLFR